MWLVLRCCHLRCDDPRCLTGRHGGGGSDWRTRLRLFWPAGFFVVRRGPAGGAEQRLAPRIPRLSVVVEDLQMDHQTFDRLTRLVGTAASRRTAWRSAARRRAPWSHHAERGGEAVQQRQASVRGSMLPRQVLYGRGLRGLLYRAQHHLSRQRGAGVLREQGGPVCLRSSKRSVPAGRDPGRCGECLRRPLHPGHCRQLSPPLTRPGQPRPRRHVIPTHQQ